MLVYGRGRCWCQAHGIVENSDTPRAFAGGEWAHAATAADVSCVGRFAPNLPVKSQEGIALCRETADRRRSGRSPLTCCRPISPWSWRPASFPLLRLEFNFLALSMWLWGGMLYLWMIALIFYRYYFFYFSPDDLSPPFWISMGAMAISTLAGSLLIMNSADAPYLESLLPFLKGFTIFYWATGTWWIPMRCSWASGVTWSSVTPCNTIPNTGGRLPAGHVHRGHRANGHCDGLRLSRSHSTDLPGCVAAGLGGDRARPVAQLVPACAALSAPRLRPRFGAPVPQQIDQPAKAGRRQVHKRTVSPRARHTRPRQERTTPVRRRAADVVSSDQPGWPSMRGRR